MTARRRKPGPFVATAGFTAVATAVLTAVFIGALAAGACRPSPPPPARVAGAGDPASPASASASAALARLAAEYWRAHLEDDPISATLLGYHGYDDRMPDESTEARERRRQALIAMRARIEAEVPARGLSASDRLTRGLLEDEIDRELAVYVCHTEEWAIDPRDGPQVSLLDLAGLQAVKTPDDRRAMVARWRAIPRAIDQGIANLGRGVAALRVDAASEVKRVARQLDELLAKPDAEWPLVAPATRVPADVPAAEREQFRRDLTAALATGIRPAFVRYRNFVRDQALPLARGDTAVGISNISGGAACYAALARAHTSLPVDPAAIHKIGLDEVARIRREMEQLGPAALGTSDFGEIQRRLRGHEPALFFTTREEIEAAARATLARAQAAMPRFLGRLPRTPCEVRRIEAHEEKDSPIAYYREPPVDGSRPGIYYVNTFDPTSRPRFDSEALAFHEAIPGHHVQIALAEEMTGVPDFRKHLGVTAFIEGWGLYAEGLGDELGLYSSPLARMGRLGAEIWRAGRLVVDTGMHALGWSRSQAIGYMLQNTTSAANNIENEIDRYIGWPGQALAYKVGELEILRLRADAKRRLGAAFDLRAFHDVVLGGGALSLPVLASEIDAWIKASAAATPAAH